MVSAGNPSQHELAAAFHDILALVILEPLPDGAPIPGLPGIWSPRPDGVPGARVELGPGEQILVDGIAAGGAVDLEPIGPFVPAAPTVALDAGRSIVVLPFPDAGAGETWIGLASESAPLLRSFRGISAYPDDDRWRIPVSFTPAEENERLSTVRHFRSGDELHSMTRAGWFTGIIDGEQYRLSVDRIPDYAYVNFRDAGSGTESYGAGRVIRLPGDPGDVDILDLNQAAVPPCALNLLLPCPLPPASNIIRTVVRAGQRDVLFS